MLKQSSPTPLSTPTLEMRLLGHFQLLLEGKPVDGLNQARLQLLLAYVTLHRDLALSRRQIAFLFWPDSSETQAFANLRKLLYLLRQALPAADYFLLFTADTVARRSDAAFTLDVADFEAAVQRGETSDAPAAKIAAYQDALARYGGDLLPGFYDDWILVERERLRTLYASALMRLAELYEAQRAYADALAYAQRLLSQDALQESSHRLLMRLHLLNDDRAAALRVYHTCATLLRDELGVWTPARPPRNSISDCCGLKTSRQHRFRRWRRPPRRWSGVLTNGINCAACGRARMRVTRSLS
jgi:DNA-binding SARP family transcriptional activator